MVRKSNGRSRKRVKRRRRWRSPEQLSPALRLAVDAVGGRMASLARLIGVTPQAIAQWDRIPAARIIDVEHATGIDRAKLRPDLYRARKA